MRRSTIQRSFAASALIVAASAALAFGVARLRREPPREVEAVASLPSSSSPASIVQGQNSVRSTAQITTNVASGAISTNPATQKRLCSMSSALIRPVTLSLRAVPRRVQSWNYCVMAKSRVASPPIEPVSS